LLNKIFWEIHDGLPRQGPGNYASTLNAYRLIKDLPAKPRILDIGCGPGMQTFDLAELSDAIITAVDNHQPFIDFIQEKVNELELFDRVSARYGDMNNLKFDQADFDVIWSEGAIYLMGFREGLTEWKKFLKPDGYVAVSEISWLKKEPPPNLQAYWDEHYPQICSIEENIKTLCQCGYDQVGHFVLPPSACWDDYYDPIQIRLNELFKKYDDHPEVLEYLMREQTEIDMYKNYPMYYGYVFYIMKNK